MRLKLKYALPLAHLVLGLALLWRTYLYDMAMRGRGTGICPALQLLGSINAPVTVARMIWFHHTPYFWDYAAYIVAIGLFWYWAALNISCWRKRRTVCLFSFLPLRLAGDVLLVAIGVVLGWFGLEDRTTLPGVVGVVCRYQRPFFRLVHLAYRPFRPRTFSNVFSGCQRGRQLEGNTRGQPEQPREIQHTGKHGGKQNGGNMGTSPCFRRYRNQGRWKRERYCAPWNGRVASYRWQPASRAPEVSSLTRRDLAVRRKWGCADRREVDMACTYEHGRYRARRTARSEQLVFGVSGKTRGLDPGRRDPASVPGGALCVNPSKVRTVCVSSARTDRARGVPITRHRTATKGRHFPTLSLTPPPAPQSPQSAPDAAQTTSAPAQYPRRGSPPATSAGTQPPRPSLPETGFPSAPGGIAAHPIFDQVLFLYVLVGLADRFLGQRRGHPALPQIAFHAGAAQLVVAQPAAA